MTGFRVNISELELLVERMASVEGRLAEMYDDVDGRMRRLQVVWTGQAATEHHEAYQQWAIGSREVHESLARLRQIAHTAHGNYGSAVNANRAMWSL